MWTRCAPSPTPGNLFTKLTMHFWRKKNAFRFYCAIIRIMTHTRSRFWFVHELHYGLQKARRRSFFSLQVHTFYGLHFLLRISLKLESLGLKFTQFELKSLHRCSLREAAPHTKFVAASTSPGAQPESHSLPGIHCAAIPLPAEQQKKRQITITRQAAVHNDLIMKLKLCSCIIFLLDFYFITTASCTLNFVLLFIS